MKNQELNPVKIPFLKMLLIALAGGLVSLSGYKLLENVTHFTRMDIFCSSLIITIL